MKGGEKYMERGVKACLHILNETKNPDIRRLGTGFFVTVEGCGVERINVDNFKSVSTIELSTSSRNLVLLAYNMFNGYTLYTDSYNNCFCALCSGLDSDNSRIVTEAVAIYLLS